MTSDDVGSQNQIDQEHAWKVLIELTLSRESRSACWAVDQVTEAMQPLNWPATRLEHVKLALVKATWNVLERSRLSGSEVPLIIRVLIPENDEGPPEASQGSDEPSQHPASERADKQSSRGWGFFLVQRQGEDPQASTERSQHVIEVFLYQESEGSRRYR